MRPTKNMGAPEGSADIAPHESCWTPVYENKYK